MRRSTASRLIRGRHERSRTGHRCWHLGRAGGGDRSGRAGRRLRRVGHAGSLYNDRADDASVAAVERTAPAHAAVHGVTSPLARATRLLRAEGVAKILHQADWIAGRFSGRFDVSDESNSLKTGYDPVVRAWPDWIAANFVELGKLPAVVPVGTIIGQVSAAAVIRFGVSTRAVVVAGATDGCAAFLATGADKPGDAVTSLGSTLVVKLASEQPLFSPEYGIYSHRIGDLWLAGGASNTDDAAPGRRCRVSAGAVRRHREHRSAGLPASGRTRRAATDWCHDGRRRSRE